MYIIDDSGNILKQDNSEDMDSDKYTLIHKEVDDNNIYTIIYKGCGKRD